MTKEQFELRIIDLHWINNEDDPTDLCAHGNVYLRIGDEILSNEESGDWTLSAAALSLMRTIKTDYKKGDFGNQLLPCCGFFMIARNNLVDSIDDWTDYGFCCGRDIIDTEIIERREETDAVQHKP